MTPSSASAAASEGQYEVLLGEITQAPSGLNKSLHQRALGENDEFLRHRYTELTPPRRGHRGFEVTYDIAENALRAVEASIEDCQTIGGSPSKRSTATTRCWSIVELERRVEDATARACTYDDAERRRLGWQLHQPLVPARTWSEQQSGAHHSIELLVRHCSDDRCRQESDDKARLERARLASSVEARHPSPKLRPLVVGAALHVPRRPERCRRTPERLAVVRATSEVGIHLRQAWDSRG